MYVRLLRLGPIAMRDARSRIGRVCACTRAHTYALIAFKTVYKYRFDWAYLLYCDFWRWLSCVVTKHRSTYYTVLA